MDLSSKENIIQVRQIKNTEFINLPIPTDDITFFQAIKDLSNDYWQHTDISKNVYGFQIQQGTKWRPGLTESELSSFEKEMGYMFPIPLRNFYLTMNGLDTPGLNVYGYCGEPFRNRPVYYSYPDDISAIKELIEWVLKENNLLSENLPAHASRFFPICAHRCLLIDEPTHPVLSMHGNDIIYWNDSLSKLIATDIFPNIYNAWDFESQNNSGKIKLWLD